MIQRVSHVMAAEEQELDAAETKITTAIDSPVPLPKALPATKKSWAGFPTPTHADPRKGSGIFVRSRPQSARTSMCSPSPKIFRPRKIVGYQEMTAGVSTIQSAHKSSKM